MTKILLVEDNNEIRENTTEILELAGYHVTTAVNGKEGYEMAQKETPDLIVCDIMMPVLDGYGLLHLINKNESLKTIPFIFLTAKTERSDFRKGMEMGADDYLTKPFTDIELLNAVESRLKKIKFQNERAKASQHLDDFFNEVKNEDALEKLTRSNVVNHYKKKHRVYSEGNHPHSLYYLNSGKIRTYKINENGKELTALQSLRQQIKKAAGQPNFSLSDFIKPNAKDYMGAFAVSIHGVEPHLKNFIAQHDDYNKIMLQAMADRLAEAFAEVLHKRTRKEFWGYVKDESLTNEELVKETYQGIRPAPGYPACPDHTEKYKLFDLLNATENAGITLTESLAMYPAASVCGWYFSHPQSTYFGVGKITQDQLQDYAKRKGMSEEEIGKWLSQNLEE